MKDDDWKGEGLIKAKPTDKQRAAEYRKLNSKIYHMNRKAQGAPLPGAKSHNRLVRAAIFTHQMPTPETP